MPFHEKSAWIMSAGLVLGAGFYALVVMTASVELGRPAPPNIPTLAVFTVILTLVAVAGHIVIAVITPKEANAQLDERERKIRNRAGNLSGSVVGVGILFSLALYLFSYDGNLLFYSVFASLMISQLAEYVVQIILYRSAV